MVRRRYNSHSQIRKKIIISCSVEILSEETHDGSNNLIFFYFTFFFSYHILLNFYLHSYIYTCLMRLCCLVLYVRCCDVILFSLEGECNTKIYTCMNSWIVKSRLDMMTWWLRSEILEEVGYVVWFFFLVFILNLHFCLWFCNFCSNQFTTGEVKKYEQYDIYLYEIET